MRGTLHNGPRVSVATKPAPTIDELTDDQHVNEKMVASVTGLSLSWVRKQRLIQQGPPWVKMGRSMRYPVRGLRTWLKTLERH